MKITAIDGRELEITDLDLALLQADDYRHYRHTDPAMAAADERLQAYWEDLYQQLLKIKTAQT
ncbi:hypothetical protein [Mucilaginibacter polytrichastri]|nr:hypothetical protein [Mucilaginibacter polytrichastri]SFT02936.1 hypothetical protein SAMN04487890_108237 [Mucilaginibacter polytrichastri]SFT23630.1 hypothetical protein SAMN04487890_1218 [Mucilaginibacter polytrichastri]SFT27714.1 hypothetical protein SAMN04487890_13311 [Mucilaginibacter polytrichastri]